MASAARLFTVSGVPGVGKTTVLNGLEEHGYVVFREELDDTCRQAVERLYDTDGSMKISDRIDMEYAFFRNHLLTARKAASYAQHHKCAVFLERCPLDTGFVFAPNNIGDSHQGRKACDDMQEDALQWVNTVQNMCELHLILLQADSEVCRQRVLHRECTGERNVPSTSYLSQIGRWYEESRLRLSTKLPGVVFHAPVCSDALPHEVLNRVRRLCLVPRTQAMNAASVPALH